MESIKTTTHRWTIWRKFLSVLLVAIMLICAYSCTRKAKRTTGIVLTTAGAVGTIGGFAVAFDRCDEDPEFPPEGNACHEGTGKIGWPLFGVGLAMTAVGLYFWIRYGGSGGEEESPVVDEFPMPEEAARPDHVMLMHD